MSTAPTTNAALDIQKAAFSLLQCEVNLQADRLFPARIPSSAWLKLYEELGEVIKKPHDAGEWGDVFILLLDLSKMHGIEIVSAVRDKMEVLEHRVWTTTATGTYQHVPGEHVTLKEGD